MSGGGIVLFMRRMRVCLVSIEAFWAVSLSLPSVGVIVRAWVVTDTRV